MVKIVQRLRRGYGKSRLSITTIVVSQWSRYLLCKLLKAGWSKYFISFLRQCKCRIYLSIPRMKMSAIYTIWMFKKQLTANARSYKIAENAFLYRRHLFFQNLSFAAIRVKLMPPYTIPFHDTLCLISFLFVSR